MTRSGKFRQEGSCVAILPAVADGGQCQFTILLHWSAEGPGWCAGGDSEHHHYANPELMDRVEEIEAAINDLPPEDFRRIADWFRERDQLLWDQKLDSDSSGPSWILFSRRPK